MTVAVVDPDPGRGASWAAAGMLAPVTEVHLRRGGAAGPDPGLGPPLAGVRGRAEAEAPAVPSATGTQRDTGGRRRRRGPGLGRRALRLPGSLGLGGASGSPAVGARQLEPSIAPGVRAGHLGTGRPPGRQPAASSMRCSPPPAGPASTVHRRTRPPPSSVTAGGGVGRALAAGHELRRRGGGAGRRQLVGAARRVARPVRVPAVRPVKGQILRPGRRARPRCCSRTVRGTGAGLVGLCRPPGGRHRGGRGHRRGTGLRRRRHGRAVYELLRDAGRVVPAITELGPGRGDQAGLRPGSPDNAPIVGPPPSRRRRAGAWPPATTATGSC